MTVSFHKYGEYFPGTGELRDIGVSNGKHYSVNFPLRDGIDDKSYKDIFEPTIGWVMEYYQPSAVVLQCGGDSLSGDRLGAFNLSMRGHANCVNFVKSFNLPTLVLGGGGYTMRNVARTWAYETGLLVGVEMGNELPFTDYYEYYAPDFELNVRPSNMDNANSPEYLEKIKQQVLENLKRTQAAPSVQMQDVPREPMGMDETLDEEEARLDDEEADVEANKDRRYTQRLWDKHTERDDELSESEDEDGLADSLGVKKQPSHPRRRGIMEWKNPHAPEDTSGANTPMDDDARSLNGDADLADGMNLDGAADARPPNGASAAEAEADAAATMAQMGASAAPTAAAITAKLEEASNQSEEAGANNIDDEENGMDVDPKEEEDDIEEESAAPLPTATSAEDAAAHIPSPAASLPQSPTDAGTAATTENVDDVEMSEDVQREKDEGAVERELEDVEAEAAAEVVGKGTL